MKKVFRIIVWIVVAVLFIGSFVFLYKNSQEKEDVYSPIHPQIGTIEQSTVLTGSIEPRDEIEIKPQISGIVSEIMVEAGNVVNEGDIIAKIKVIPDASQLSSAQSRVDVANIDLNDASVKFNRDKELFAKGVISRQDFEDSEKTFKKAQEELTSAQDAYNIVREGVSRLNASESNTLVRATITGLILDVPVKVGSSVIQANTMNDGTTVATIADMNKLIFKGKVDETEVGLLRVGMPMDIAIGAMPDLKPEATIEYISPKGDDSSGANTYEIKAAIMLDDVSGLRAGYSANATVILKQAKDVITISETAVSFKGDSTFVYVMTDSLPKPVYERRHITTGLSDGINIEVRDGIDVNTTLRGSKI